MQAGERFLLQSAGGGGYGDPGRRDADAIARDIEAGYVSAEGALRDYPVEKQQGKQQGKQKRTA
jgi:N-methylhydantoinase B